MMVENILEIASDFFSYDKKIKITVLNNNKIKISPSYFYTIIILCAKESDITITSKWKYGIMGSIFLKKEKINSMKIIEKLEKKYSNKNYNVSKIYIS